MKREFLDSIRASRQTLVDAIVGVDEETLISVAVCGTWTAKDVLGHIAAWDGLILKESRRRRHGEPESMGFDIDGDYEAANVAEAAIRQNWSLADALAELHDNRHALLDEFDAWPGDSAPFGPDTWDSDKSEIRWLPSHELEHAREMAALRSSCEDNRIDRPNPIG